MTDFELCELIEEGAANDCDVSAEIREFYKNIPEDGPQIKMQKLDVFIRKKVQENPESIEWSGAYTNFCFFRGTPEKSYTCLNKACNELHTQVAQAWFFLASLEWKFRGNKDEAYKCVYRAIQLDPEDFSSLFLLGLANHFIVN